MALSIDHYKQAIAIMESDVTKYSILGPRPEELVAKAEKELGLHFASQYRDFLLRFGTAHIGYHEIYGVIDDDFENSSVPDAIWYTLVERHKGDVRLPSHLVIISDTGDGGLLCLDFKRLTNDSEPTVVHYEPGLADKSQTYEVVAADFGDFLLDCISQ